VKSIFEQANDNHESPRSREQLPRFLRINALTFTSLIEDYYKFLNEEGNPSNVINRIIAEHDLDKVVDDKYLEGIRTEIAKAIPTSPYVQKAFLLKRIVDSYAIRGNEESIKYFFRIFFNEDTTVYNPWEQVLIPSQGKWTQSTRARVVLYIGDKESLTNATLIQYDQQGRLRASIGIKEAAQVSAGQNYYYELSLRGDSAVGAFDDALEVQTEDGSCRGYLLRSMSGIRIVDPGLNYSIGDKIYLGTKENITFYALVTRVDQDGKIVAISISDYGMSSNVVYSTGIQNDPEAIPNQSSVYLNGIIAHDDPNGYYLNTRPEESDSDFYFYFSDDNDYDFNALLGAEVDVTALVTSLGLIASAIQQKLDEAITHDFGYYDEVEVLTRQVILDFSKEFKALDNVVIQTTKSDLTVSPASFKFSFDTIYDTDGYYDDEKGRPSGFSVLQDSFYYQIFSYEVNSKYPIKKWVAQLNELIHPGGFKVFGRINSSAENSIDIDPYVNITFDANYHPQATNVTVGLDLTSFLTAYAQDYTYDDPYLYDAYGFLLPLGYVGYPYFLEGYTSTTAFRIDLFFGPTLDPYDPYTYSLLYVNDPYDPYDPYTYELIMTTSIVDNVGYTEQLSDLDPDPYILTDSYGFGIINALPAGTKYYRREGHDVWTAV